MLYTLAYVTQSILKSEYSVEESLEVTGNDAVKDGSGVRKAYKDLANVRLFLRRTSFMFFLVI